MNWSPGPVRVTVPATSANLGPGFDALGLALRLHDVVEARVTGDGLSIEVAGEGDATASAGERHLVVRAMRAAFAAMGGQPPGLALRCANSVPHGRGLGSSAGAIVSGLLAARALVAGGGGLLPDGAVFRLAVSLEGHADNVAACLAGGLTLAWTPRAGRERGAGERGPERERGAEREQGPGRGQWEEGGGPGPRLVRLPVLAELSAVVCVPPVPLATETARGVLPPMVPHADAAANAARSALLVTALTSDPSVLVDATEDFLHQPYRSSVMPATADLLARLRRAGIAAVMSGAGPSVLALFFSGAGPGSEVVDSMTRETGIPWRVIPLDVDRDGARVQPGGPDSRLPGRARPGSPANHRLDAGHAGWSP